MKPKLKWICYPDTCTEFTEPLFFCSYRHRKRIDKVAQQLADEYQVTFVYHSNRARSKARRLGKDMRVYLVAPKTIQL